MAKNNSKAVKLFSKGNDFFEKQQYCEALLAFNHSLCLANAETLITSMCYEKRSTVYFHLKEYELCLANIELARPHCPVNKLCKLDDLKAACIQLMKTHRHAIDEDPLNFLKLSYPSNEKLPCLADCLQFKVNKKFGRHIISTRDLKVGDIVAVTDFSFIFFDKRGRLHHCSHCTKSSTKLHLIPCTGCAKAMYCSNECMINDKKKFHQFECGIDDNPEDQHLDYNPLKILIQILAEFDGNVDEMKKFVEANKKSKCVYDFDLSDKDSPMYTKNMILATLSMSHNMNCAELGKWHCLSTHHRFIMKHPKLREMWMSPHKKFLDKLLLKFLDVEDVKGRINCFNEIDINLKERGYDLIDQKTDVPAKIDTFFTNVVADVNDPYMSLLNQSCYPNIITKFVNSKHAWIVIRPVKAGEQLFMCRGPGNKYATPRAERQRNMQEHFGFYCDCDGCLNDWPTSDKMKKLDGELMLMLMKDLQLKSELNGNQPKLYGEYMAYSAKIQAMSKYYPCWDIVNLEQKLIFTIYRLALPAKWFSRAN